MSYSGGVSPSDFNRAYFWVGMLRIVLVMLIHGISFLLHSRTHSLNECMFWCTTKECLLLISIFPFTVNPMEKLCLDQVFSQRKNSQIGCYRKLLNWKVSKVLCITPHTKELSRAKAELSKFLGKSRPNTFTWALDLCVYSTEGKTGVIFAHLFNESVGDKRKW